MRPPRGCIRAGARYLLFFSAASWAVRANKARDDEGHPPFFAADLTSGPDNSMMTTSSAVLSAETEAISYSGGSCGTLDLAHYCGSALSATPVLQYEGADSESLGARIRDFVEIVRTVDTDCADALRRTSCLATFMPCDPVSKEPRKMCRSSCVHLVDTLCPGSNVTLAVDCDASIGDSPSIYGAFLEDMRDTHAFAESNTYLSHETLASCVDVFATALEQLGAVNDSCPQPFETRRFPAVADFASTNFVSPGDTGACADGNASAACFSSCEVPCPYPKLHSNKEALVLWLSRWVPGLLSIPLNVVVLVNEIIKRRVQCQKTRRRRRADANVRALSVLALIMGSLDAGTALILREDAVCGGEATFTRYGGHGGHPFCKIGILYEHIAQTFVTCLAMLLVRLNFQIQAVVGGTEHRDSAGYRAFRFGAAFLAPVGLAAVSLTRQEDPLSVLSSVFRVSQGGLASAPSLLPTISDLRYRFACGPRFRTVVEAFALVDGPILAATLLAAAAYARLLIVFRRLRTEFWTSRALVSTTATRDRVMLRLFFTTSRIAIVVLPFLVSSMLSLRMYKFASLGEDLPVVLAYWDVCAAAGFTNGASLVNVSSVLAPREPVHFCPRIRASIPHGSSLIAFALARSSPPLLFGATFARAAWLSQRLRRRHRRAHRVAPTGIAATSAVMTVLAADGHHQHRRLGQSTAPPH